MKKVLFLGMTMFLLSACVTTSQGGKDKEYYPQVFFDKNQAYSQLTEGRSVITGVAYVSERSKLGMRVLLGNKHIASNEKVMLFPVNAYFDEWHRLRKAHPKARVYMSDEAYKYRLETTTDSYGNFTFNNVKPGKYFLMSQAGWIESGIATTYDGYNAATNTEYYSQGYYSVDYSKSVEDFVEVKFDGEIVKMKLNGSFIE